jgi:hypothetical protein
MLPKFFAVGEAFDRKVREENAAKDAKKSKVEI